METSIRLATAHAKSRASRSVEPEDAEAAIQLMRYAYFGSQRGQGEGEEQGGEEEGDGDGGHEVDTGDDDMQEKGAGDAEAKFKLFVSSLARYCQTKC